MGHDFKRYARALVSVACLLVTPSLRAQPITMTIVYDNTVYVPGTIPDWGFACMIEGIERPILFDTGNQSGILLQNIAALQLDLNAVDDIVLSHNHYDHTYGLGAVLDANSQVNVYLGASFPASFEQMIASYGATPIRVIAPIETCSLVHASGELGGAIPEQALVIEAAEGLVVITGCAHPGIVAILERAQEIAPGPIYLVIGGFHLLNSTPLQIQQIVSSFRALGVQKVGPTHCTGDLAIQIFQLEYGENCLTMGTGREILVSPLVAVDEETSEARISSAPNPFNASTTIGFTLAEATTVRVTVHDLAGRTLATLADGATAAPGRHEITWDGRDAGGRSLPSGTYLCRLTTAQGAQTKKVNLVK